MYSDIDIINSYKKIKKQKQIKKIPKLKNETLKNINILTNNLNTKWIDIDLDTYMFCGHSLWKSFSYKKFLDKKIIQKYIHDDKIKKRNNANKDSLIKSFEFLKNNKFTNLSKYCNIKIDNLSKPIFDYIQNNIDKILIYYLIKGNFIHLSNIEYRYVEFINYDNKEMEKYYKQFSRYIKKLEKEL